MDDYDLVPTVFHPRKPINRKTKVNIVFDPKARREFLTGFHKRKLQRQKQAQEELQQMLKEERKTLKQEAKESYKKLVASHRTIPELENLLEKHYEVENHCVNVVELSASDLAKKNNWIGVNKVEYDNEEDEEEDEDGVNNKTVDDIPGMQMKTKKEIKKAIKKQATKQVKKSKAFQVKSKIERFKNKRKSLQEKKRRLKLQNRSKKNKHKQQHKQR
ncbi:ribosomal RNA-processing protein 17 [Schistocerca piceifrons]|uniref:ribosomal RNA-processing protein 17 n=1 Tax=Schistocerca piceifrons TaxID=274613 RepID=UPI001F5E499A|nr:ribosomal RNA-processing protein 17 [Schistocerca piceifrons]